MGMTMTMGIGKGKELLTIFLILFLSLVYRWEPILAIHHLSQTQNNVVKYCLLQFACKMKFLAVCQVVLMTHRECCVDPPFPYHVTDVG
jgi:hypothetical protein